MFRFFVIISLTSLTGKIKRFSLQVSTKIFMTFSILAALVLRGRVLLRSDSQQNSTIPNGAKLIIRLQDVSIADAQSDSLAELELKNISNFPIEYQLEVSSSIVRDVPICAISARIMKDSALLFINDEQTIVDNQSESPQTIDISVIDIRTSKFLFLFKVFKKFCSLLANVEQTIKQSSWPELVGLSGSYAVDFIKKQTGSFSLGNDFHCQFLFRLVLS